MHGRSLARSLVRYRRYQSPSHQIRAGFFSPGYGDTGDIYGGERRYGSIQWSLPPEEVYSLEKGVICAVSRGIGEWVDDVVEVLIGTESFLYSQCVLLVEEEIR